MTRPLHALVQLVKTLFDRLDDEKISTFQTMYYVLFSFGSLLLIFFPDFNVQYLGVTTGHFAYDLWLGLVLICPILTLIGRHLTARAATKKPGEPNSAVGAAYLQFTGDVGVWGAVIIYFVSMIMTGRWSQELFSFIFIFMGVSGGGMFTARSVRRIVQIEKRTKKAKDKGWAT